MRLEKWHSLLVIMSISHRAFKINHLALKNEVVAVGRGGVDLRWWVGDTL